MDDIKIQKGAGYRRYTQPQNEITN